MLSVLAWPPRGTTLLARSGLHGSKNVKLAASVRTKRQFKAGLQALSSKANAENPASDRANPRGPCALRPKGKRKKKWVM
jgi:hypothetical protein